MILKTIYNRFKSSNWCHRRYYRIVKVLLIFVNSAKNMFSFIDKNPLNYLLTYKLTVEYFHYVGSEWICKIPDGQKCRPQSMCCRKLVDLFILKSLCKTMYKSTINPGVVCKLFLQLKSSIDNRDCVSRFWRICFLHWL